jgi:hypothetical protein
MTDEQEQFWKKWKPVVFMARVLATITLFHKQLGWPTLPLVLSLYEYFFIGSNIVMTGISGLGITALVYLVGRAQLYDRNDYKFVERETLLAHPFNSLVNIFVVIGIWQFGYPILSVAYLATVALTEMAQTCYIYMMQRIDEMEST